jgi:hypothetical protein
MERAQVAAEQSRSATESSAVPQTVLLIMLELQERRVNGTEA